MNNSIVYGPVPFRRLGYSLGVKTSHLRSAPIPVSTVRSEPVDYVTFVTDGEPTLDINLVREIELLCALGIKIAVITKIS